MTATTLVGLVFLVVSTENLVVQLCALHRLFRWPLFGTRQQTQVYRGLLRTSMCRVLAAVTYTALGSAALAGGVPAVWPLAVFTGVQVMWQANAVADVRLRRQLQQADRRGDTSADTL